MYTEEEIKYIIQKGENNSVEFKEAEVRPESIAKEIVGFANSQGGMILIGVTDDGELKGISKQKNYDEFLANILRNNVVPPIECSLEIVSVNKKNIAVIEINKGADKPYQTNDGKFLLRIGSTIRSASQGELLRMFQQAGIFHFDLTPVRNTSVSDLNMFKVDRHFEKYDISLTSEPDEEKINILKNADILTEKGELTIAGALIFGINPPKYLPQSGISYARFNGDEITSELIDKKEINGNLENVVDEAVSVVYNQIPQASDIIDTKRVDKYPSWSKRAFREVIANACIHRNYSIAGSKIRIFRFNDRIEFISPGKLPNSVTVDKLKIGVSFAVNPVIVKFMENMGYIDKLGRGIPLVVKEAKAINKSLHLKEIGEEFKVTLEL